MWLLLSLKKNLQSEVVNGGGYNSFIQRIDTDLCCMIVHNAVPPAAKSVLPICKKENHDAVHLRPKISIAFPSPVFRAQTMMPFKASMAKILLSLEQSLID
jgi:hypothetical protein